MSMSRSLGWSVVIAFALIALAVLGTAWTTRGTVVDAVDEVRRGEALAAEQTVRAELADLGGPPNSDDLAAILHDHNEEGVRYLALVGPHGRPLATAGTPVAGADDTSEHVGRKMAIVGGRMRLELRTPFRRAWGEGGRSWSVVLEVEPVQADAMRSAARRTLDIGALAALVLLAAAAVLVRRELRRQADEGARERDKRLASLGEMSAVLAHEIKNPLASLKGNAQLLAAMLPEGEKPRAKAQRVVDEALRLEQLTVDLLAFVRTGAIARAPADPAALVRDAAASAGDGIAVDAAGAPPSWSLDAARVRQVIVNLIDNAISAGPPARAIVRTEAGRLLVEIADRGPGVPEADREKIFEPFHTGKTHGTGLGLAVARRIVEQHGGTLTVHDAPGGGALFRVSIPA
jgi:two-component system sensor histidine kinase HydH